MKKTNELVKILMQRDNISKKEAEMTILKVEHKIIKMIDDGNMFDAVRFFSKHLDIEEEHILEFL